MTKSITLKLQNLAINASNFRLEICTVTAIISAIYVFTSLFQIRVLIGFFVFISSVLGLAYFKWRNVREKGIISFFSPKLRQLLLKRSIYDMYRDQVYFPYFTKILGVFIKGAIAKPHPEQLDQLFEQLPENVRKTIFTKGILHLTPQKVEKMVLERQPDVLSELQASSQAKPPQMIVPKSYGTVNPMWDRRLQYEAQEDKIHEKTISNEILHKLNEKVKWGHILVLTSLLSYAVMKTKGKKLGKILLYNGSVLGIFLLAALIVIKYKNPLIKYKDRLVERGQKKQR